MAYRKNVTAKTATRYTIQDHTEETSCDWCGCPLYVGDRAYPNADEIAVFCCDAERRAWNREERESHTVGGGFDCPANA